jgi:hypothetical protein
MTQPMTQQPITQMTQQPMTQMTQHVLWQYYNLKTKQVIVLNIIFYNYFLHV